MQKEVRFPFELLQLRVSIKVGSYFCPQVTVLFSFNPNFMILSVTKGFALIYLISKPSREKNKSAGFPQNFYWSVGHSRCAAPVSCNQPRQNFPNLGKKVKQVWVYKQEPCLTANHFGNFLEVSEC